MDGEAAVNLIPMHGTGYDDVPLENALFNDGFLGCLRRFLGLRDDNFLRVILVEALCELTRQARFWRLDPNGMSRSN